MLLLLHPITAIVVGLLAGYFLAEKVVLTLTILAAVGFVYNATHPLEEMGKLLTLTIGVDLVVFVVVMLGTASFTNGWWANADLSWLFRK